MRIELEHPKFSGVELRGGTLVVHSMQGGSRVLRENVQDAAVVTVGGELRIAAFVSADYAWFFKGEEELHSERVELGQPYGGGGRLIGDGAGRSHLFYFVRQPPGSSCVLRHLQYTGTWSNPQTVSANVFGETWGYSVSWHSDNYLHLAYLAHKDRGLLYRVYDLEHGLWSGAVTFSDAVCAYPQFLPVESLYLLWLEEGDQTMLKVRAKSEKWSAPIALSTGQQHAGLVGFACSSGQWSVVWSEGSALYQVPLGLWDQRSTAAREDFDYIWRVHQGLTIPMYQAKESQKEEVPEVPPPEETAQEQSQTQAQEQALPPRAEDEQLLAQFWEAEKVRRQREAEQAQAQAAFMEQAFRVLKEWDEVRDEIRRWRRDWRAVEQVDLSPFTARLERVERRYLSLKQAQEQVRTQGEASLAQLEREVLRLRSRVEDLEKQQKTKARPFWQRVLGRA